MPQDESYSFWELIYNTFQFLAATQIQWHAPTVVIYRHGMFSGLWDAIATSLLFTSGGYGEAGFGATLRSSTGLSEKKSPGGFWPAGLLSYLSHPLSTAPWGVEAIGFMHGTSGFEAETPRS